MAQELSLEELKDRLLELIEGSEALKTIPEEEKNERTALMMAGNAEEIAGYIQVFEEETQNIDEINEELNEHAEEIQEAVITEKYDDIKLQRKLELEKEKKLRISEEKKADSLISALENVEKAPVKAKKKLSDWEKIKKLFSDYFKKRLTLKKIVRGSLASIIGLILCGLSGLLVIFAVISAMKKYEQFEVAFSIKPPVIFHAYWIAFIFAALIGLFIIPVLRLINTRSTFLSGIFGGIIGALIVAVSHMAFGLNYDISILLDGDPIGLRGYWAALIFAILIGFFAQLINRLINRSSFFKIAEE